jgi:uncharacterized membrane protein
MKALINSVEVHPHCTLCNLGNKRVAYFANMSHPEAKKYATFLSLSLFFFFGVYLETCIIIGVNIGLQHVRTMVKYIDG